MPVPDQIVAAAASYAFSAQMLEKSFAGLTPEEWQAHPGDSSNPMLWIVGHIVWARGNALGLLGTAWSRPWTALFARGAHLANSSEYPSPEELIAAWQDVKESFASALEQANAEALAAPGPPKTPSFDGKLSGVLAFLAWHEAYHVGQAAYLRRWLGHDQVAG